MKTAVSVNWSAANWFTTSGGSTAAVPPLPLCHDTNAVFDVNSVTAGSRTITVDQPRISGFDWTGVANTPAFATGSSEFEIYGNAILVSGMTHTGTGQADLSGRSAYSLDGGTLTWPTSSALAIKAPTGTYSLARNFSSNSSLTVTNGTLNGAFTTSFTTLTVNGGTFTVGGTATLTGALAVSSGTLNMNSQQITGHTTATISSTGTLNLSGQLNGSGAISVTGGTITDAGASGELKGTTASFSGGTSTIRKMTLSSTFAISSTANLTLNPGTYTYVTSWTETGTTKTFSINGTLAESGGVKTVTAAAAGGGARIFQSGIIQGFGVI